MVIFIAQINFDKSVKFPYDAALNYAPCGAIDMLGASPRLASGLSEL
jgi:hypothetical protein